MMRDNILFRDLKDCCGCTACMSICPVQAIEMKADAEGFEYPYIDERKCIGCEQCIRVCPIKKVDEK